MARLIEITDAQDPAVDDFRDLTTADRRPDRPGGRGLVIGEGRLVVERLLASPYPIRGLLGERKRINTLEPLLRDLDVPAYIVEPETLAKIVGFHLNRGVLAVADRAPEPDPVELIRNSRKLAVLEGVVDHENLGAMFRNAAGLGLDGVLLGRGCSDPLYRRSVRVSMGHVLRVPFARLPNWPGDLELLGSHGFRVAALAPRPDAVPVGRADLANGKVAVLMGSEGPGLSEEALRVVDLTVGIPMSREVDSLNVAASAAIVFHAMREEDS
ncbi:TrmH family RNA methyltransferase [Actinopolyspora xinjiangensis]|uniref:TrmH family RNA methyltransferase n=1 Tax=Actinopolyspora xinjiangensis TaxID=405564 RepID=UPI001B8D8903|nr:RNA methyltransferase [Actinopolyspora xinjiangensis]